MDRNEVKTNEVENIVEMLFAYLVRGNQETYPAIVYGDDVLPSLQVDGECITTEQQQRVNWHHAWFSDVHLQRIMGKESNTWRTNPDGHMWNVIIRWGR